MNENFPDQLYNGILLCISLQLVLLAFVKFYSRKRRAVLLGVLCFLIGVVFFNTLFWHYVKQHFILSLFIGAGKEIFFGPLIYLYVSLAYKKQNSKLTLIKHLILPASIHLIYLIIKFGFKEFYAIHYVNLVTYISLLQWIMLLFYFGLGIYSFKNQLKNYLHPDIKKRYQLFLYGLLTYFFIKSTYGTASMFIPSEFWGNRFLFNWRYFFSPLAIIMDTYLIFFTLTESLRFKSYFVRSKLVLDPVRIGNNSHITALLNQYFYEDKIFKDPTLSVDTVAKKLQISKNVLRYYLKQEFGLNFKEFINQLRVDEFKNLLEQDSYRSYSFIGISSMVGFQSNATFFRVFKQIEGMTPSEYQKKRTPNQ